MFIVDIHIIVLFLLLGLFIRLACLTRLSEAKKSNFAVPIMGIGLIREAGRVMLSNDLK